MKSKVWWKYICLCIGVVIVYAIMLFAIFKIGVTGGTLFLICSPTISFWYGIISHKVTNKTILPFLIFYVFSGAFMVPLWTCLSLCALIYPCINLFVRGFNKITVKIKEEKFEFIKQQSNICIIFCLTIVAFVFRVCILEFLNFESHTTLIFLSHLFGFTPYLCALIGNYVLKIKTKRLIVAFSFVFVNLLLYVTEFIIYGRSYMALEDFCFWILVIAVAEIAICLISHLAGQSRLKNNAIEIEKEA